MRGGTARVATRIHSDDGPMSADSRSVTVALVVVVAAVAGGATGLTAPAGAQPQGFVELQEPITADESSFQVEVSFEEPPEVGVCLRVENLNEDTVYQTSVSQSDEVTVPADEVGGLSGGDEIEARLYEDSDCLSQTDDDTTTVTGGAASFDVEIESTNSPIVEGETLEVTTTIQNTGGEEDTQDVDLLIGDLVVDSRTVSIAAGESETVTLEWTTDDGFAGDYDATVGTEDDSASRDVRVEEEGGGFVVSVEDTNSPVVEGETLAVTASIANTKDVTDTQRIELNAGGSTVNATSLTLDAGESRIVTLGWETEVGDAGGYTAIVASEDTTGTAEVTVIEQGDLTVEIETTTSPVDEGEPLDVTATVRNTGEEPSTQTVGLRIDGQLSDTTTVAVDPGESETVTLTWDTSARLPGTYTATVVTEDGATDSTEVTIRERAVFAVTIDGTNSPVVEGEQLDVSATVENTGETEGTQTIELRVDGSTVESTTLTLDGGETADVTLSWETIDGDAGEYTAAVASEDTGDSATVTVEEPATFEIEIDGTTSPVDEGESLDVTATVENTGGVTDTQSIGLSVDGEATGSTTLTLDGGESEQVSLAWARTGGEAGEHVATVASEDDDDATNVTVESGTGANGQADDPQFAVEIESTTAPVTEGEPIEVTAQVTNRGSETDTQPITLTAAGTEHERRQLTVAGGETEEVTLTWETLHGEAGEYAATAASPGDEDAADVTVTEAGEAPTFAVTIDDVAPPEGGDSQLVVTTTIENVDDRADTQVITLSAAGSERDRRELTLAGGETETLELTWATDSLDEGVDLEVASESDSDTSAAAVGDESSVSATTWAILLLLLLLIVAGYYYYRRRRGEQRPDVEEA